jgi:Tfp pilus assembly protein PilZ
MTAPRMPLATRMVWVGEMARVVQTCGAAVHISEQECAEARALALYTLW